MSIRNSVRTCLLAACVVTHGVPVWAVAPTDVAADGDAARAAVHETASGPAPTRVPASTPDALSTSAYANARYGYVVDYPDRLLTPEPEAADGDGRVFSAKFGVGQVAVWGRYNATGDTPAQLLHAEEEDTCAVTPPTYEVSRRDWFAFSCETSEHEIVYQKMVIRDETIAVVEFTYPLAEQAGWAPVIKAMADSLRIETAP
jgi:hypothetical protein